MSKKINPGKGYRLLRVGEFRPAGYERKSSVGGGWKPGILVGYQVEPGGVPLRVRIPVTQETPKTQTPKEPKMPTKKTPKKPVKALPPSPIFPDEKALGKLTKDALIRTVILPTIDALNAANAKEFYATEEVKVLKAKLKAVKVPK